MAKAIKLKERQTSAKSKFNKTQTLQYRSENILVIQKNILG